MQTKTYHVRSLREAVVRIREELGPQASLLYTRRLESSGWPRWVNPLKVAPRWEVIASAEAVVPRRCGENPADQAGARGAGGGHGEA